MGLKQFYPRDILQIFFETKIWSGYEQIIKLFARVFSLTFVAICSIMQLTLRLSSQT